MSTENFEKKQRKFERKVEDSKNDKKERDTYERNCAEQNDLQILCNIIEKRILS